MSKKIDGIKKGKQILEKINILSQQNTTEVKASQWGEGRVLHGTKAAILRAALSTKLQRNTKIKCNYDYTAGGQSYYDDGAEPSVTV